MPKLEEGNLWIRATLPMSVSYEESAKYVARLRSAVRGCPEDPNVVCTNENRRFPEIKLVQSQMGRPDDGTDVTGFFNIELFAPLIAFDEFPKGVTKAKLVDTISSELYEKFPGVVFNFSQMISDNVEEAVAGVKGENSIKVFGPSVEENESNAQLIVDTMSKVAGVADLGLFHSLGQPAIKITPDRQACARYGLNTGDVDAVVQAAVGGLAVTQVYEGEKSFDLTIRWLPEHRASPEAIQRITVTTSEGMNIPLAQLAKMELLDGPANIYREDGQRYAPVKFSVRGRDLASAIDESQQKISENVTLPYDSHLEWAGEINELKDAQTRLMFIVPLSFVLIGLLSYLAVRSWMDTLIVLIDIPVACTGGILALLVTGEHFSVSAAMGFVSIFGIAIQDAILVVTYFQRLHLEEGHSIVNAAREAAEKRFRPVLMTTLVACLGLLPAAMSNGIGAQTQKPLAIVVIGGSLIVAILTRVLQPTMLVVAHTWREGYERRRAYAK
jgi:cobalt-zinc-cadmium resistance protein CzcA